MPTGSPCVVAGHASKTRHRPVEHARMKRPVIGVIASTHLVENRFPAQRVGERNLHAVVDVIGGMPLMFAGCPELTDVNALLEVVDGVLLTGGRANVHPSRFGVEPDPKYEPYDQRRDALALALTEACVERGVPLFGICRGLQEMGVAFGSSLHPEIRELPGRVNHRMLRLENGEPHPDFEVIFGDRHDVHLLKDGAFARLLGKDTIRANSLHGQGILEPGARVVGEGTVDDCTIAATRMPDSLGFGLGLQWLARYDLQKKPISRTLFQVFGEAVQARLRAK